MIPITPTDVPRDKVSPLNKGKMKQITIEVPEGISLLKKPNQAAVWLKSLIGPLEGKNLILIPLSPL